MGVWIRGVAAATCVAAVAAWAALPMGREWISPRHATSSAGTVTSAVDTGLERRPGPAKVAPVILLLKGDVVDLPSPTGLAVRAYAGNTAFDATVEPGTARYSVRVIAPPSTPVAVFATAPKVQYVSRLGSAARLKRHSRGDGILERSEAPALRVSALTTAIGNLKGQLYDEPNDEQSERATRALAGNVTIEPRTDVSDMAYLLRAMAMGTIALPSNMPDNDTAVGNPATYAALRDNNAAALAGARYLYDTDAYAPLASLSELPAALFLSGTASPDVFFGVSDAYLFVRGSGSAVTVHTGIEGDRYLGKVASRAAQPDYTASLAAGDVVLRPNSTARVEAFSRETGERTFRSIVSRTLRRLTRDERQNLWLLTTVFDESYPDTGAPTARKQEAGMLWSMDLQQAARTDLWPAPPVRIALPVTCARPTTSPESSGSYAIGECEFAQHRFDYGSSGGTEDVGAKVDAYLRPQAGHTGNNFDWWRSSDGGLHVSTLDTETTFWITQHIDDVADEAVFLAEGNSGSTVGQTYVGLAMIVRGDSLPMSAGQATGTWGYPSPVRSLPYPEGSAALGYRRASDGTFADYFGPTGLDGTPTHPGTWTLANGRTFDTRYRARFSTGTRYVSDCTSAFASGAQSCAPARVRYFRPLARVGNRYYGIVSFYTQSTLYSTPYPGPFTVTPDAGYGIAYECLADGCLSAATAALDSRRPAPIVAVHGIRRTRHANLRFPMRRLRP